MPVVGGEKNIKTINYDQWGYSVVESSLGETFLSLTLSLSI